MKKYFLVFLGFSFISYAEEKKATDEISSIVDELEKKLIEDEVRTLEFEPSDKKISAENKKTEPKEKIKFKPKVIEGKTTGDQEILDFKKDIQILENDIEKLVTEVHRSKQAILSQSNIQNQILLDAKLNNINNTMISTLTVQVDGFKIYHWEEPTGTQMPESNFPLYSGPLPPGEHKIELFVRTLFKDSSTLKLAQDSYREEKAETSLSIPEGNFQKNITVTIEGGATAKDKPKIQFINVAQAPPAEEKKVEEKKEEPKVENEEIKK